MKIAQLFERKTNPSQHPRCCHKRDDGTECNAHPRTGRQYCFLHDPASQKKSAAARRAGGVLRSRQDQAILELPPNLFTKPLQKASDVTEFLSEALNQFCHGKIDLRAATEMRYLALAVLRSLELDLRAQRQATGKADHLAKKQPIETVNFVVRDIVTKAVYDPHKTVETSIPNPFSPPGQPDPKPDTKEAQPDQGQQQSISPTSAASTQAKDCAKAPQPTKAQPQAKAQQPNKQNEPKPDDQNKPSQNHQSNPQPNGHSALSQAPPSAQPVAPAPQENPPVQYPPGLGPRYMTVATPSMPWWRRQQFNNPGFVTGTAPQTAETRVAAARFRGTRR